MTTTTPTDNRKRNGVLVAVATAALGIGFFGGAQVGEQKATPAPAPTVVTTANVVPESCLKALDEADKGFEAASIAFGYVAQAFDAVAVGDWDKVNTMATKMSVQSDKISKLKYREYADACRAEA